MRSRREEEELLGDVGLVAPAIADGPMAGFAAVTGGAAHPIGGLLARRGTSEAARAALMRSLQRGAGNQAVLRLLRQADDGGEEPAPADDAGVSSLVESFTPEDHTEVPDQSGLLTRVDGGDVQPSDGQPAGAAASGAENAVTAPPVGFVDAGRTGTRRYGDPDDGPRLAPRAFTNGGQTGTVVWAGGGGAGAHGNEGAGSIQTQVAPIYDAAANATPPKFDGWVRAATGTIAVTRSWVGINSGDQGNGHYVTPAAAARINLHETLHAASTSVLYAAYLAPLEARIVAYRQGGSGVNIGTDAADAQARVQTAVSWAASLTAFQTADLASNRPGGPVDTTDVASGTYPVDIGPGTVGGVAFQHRVRTPSEPNPAP